MYFNDVLFSDLLQNAERGDAMPTPPAQQDASPKTSQEAFEQQLKKRLRSRHSGSSALTADEIRQGVPFERLETTAHALGVTQETLTHVLGVSERTLQRRKEKGQLSASESDRFERLARIHRAALQAFDENEEEARYWLTTPKRALSGETPLEHLDTEPGTRAVAEMLVMIDQTLPA